MTNWIIGENESPKSYLEKPEVVVGDTIEVVSNNQLGYKKYEVILENGKKTLKILVADLGARIFENIDDDDNVTEEKDGGRKSRKNRKSRKSKKSRKVRKSRRGRKSRSSRKRKYMR